VSGTGVDSTAIAIAVGEPLASAVLDDEARIEAVDVPGMRESSVWSVTDELGDHPMRLYVGRWPDGSVRLLTADQEAWADLARAVGVHLGNADEARAYVEAFLEVTRGTMVLVEPVTTLDDLRWRPGSDGEEAAKDALLADPPPLSTVAEVDGDGFHVELTLVVNQRLQRNSFEVSTNGDIDSSYRVLAEGLPLPIIR
jgi:hypothetical protein